MTKGGIREIRGSFRDPRAEQTEPRVPVPATTAPKGASSPPNRPSIHDVMRELSLDLPPPSAGAVSGVQGVMDSPLGTPSQRDPFGIVGTTQAETFFVESVVAHGGFGVIYRARHVRFRAPVALKCLKIPNNLTQEERTDFFERFRSEGEVMFRLSSSIPEVVRPMQVDALKLADGRFVPFIALEWLEGETLKDVIVGRIQSDKPPVSLSKGVEMLTPVARALARAHHFPGPEGALAILHCDLKPDNLFVAKTSEGEIFKIFDFGIAKVRSAATRVAGGATVSDAASNMFTPAYAAPEQWAPDQLGQAGPWTDVFALALTLTELVTQKPAIDGPPAAMLMQCMDPKKRPTPNRFGLELPPEVDAIFARALAVDPKNRTQTVEQFWGELEDACRLPRLVGAGSRLSLPSIAPVLPSWDDEPIQRAASSHPPVKPPSTPPNDHFPSLDLDLPVPSSPRPVAPRAQAAEALPSELSLARPSTQDAPGPMAIEPVEQDFEGGFDLVDDAVRPAALAPPPGPSMPAAPMANAVASSLAPADYSQQAGSQQAGSQQAGENDGPGTDLPVGPTSREKLAQAAAVAGAAATQAAGAAARGAVSLAHKAIKVDRSQVVKLDDPMTWIRPMRGPIVALALAVLITIGAVVVNKATGSSFKVVYISLPLLLAAVGFCVYRFIKLDKA